MHLIYQFHHNQILLQNKALIFILSTVLHDLNYEDDLVNNKRNVGGGTSLLFDHLVNQCQLFKY